MDNASLQRDRVEERGVTAPQKWEGRTLAEMVDFILATYHGPLRDELPRLEALAAQVAQAHGAGDVSELDELAHLITQLADELLTHMDKEERVLFPWIRSGNGAATQAPIQVMRRDHSDTQAALARMRELTDGYTVPDEAGSSWRSLWDGLAHLDGALTDHISLEEDVLFPRALSGGS